MHALQDLHDGDLLFSGVGGENMQAQGLSTIFPMEELSLLGFLEIVPHIPTLLKRIEQTANAIIALKPDIVVTIDAPAFNHRVAKRLKDKGCDDIPLVHYVAPSVWAYKPGRAEKIAKLYDHLLCLLPFEPPYFEVHGLKSTFIGHPITEHIPDKTTSDFLIEKGFTASHPTLAIMPGSRNSELKRMLPIFKKTVEKLQKDYDNLQTIILSTPRFHERLSEGTKDWSKTHIVLSDEKEKNTAIDFSTVALAKSGTGSVELSLAGLPVVIGYKVNPVSAMILRKLIQVEYVNLVNIIIGREVIPECLQQDCTANTLYNRLKPLLDDEYTRTIQLDQAQEALIKMGKGQTPKPSYKAAELVLSLTKS